DGAEHALQVDLVVQLADLGVAAGDHQVGFLDGPLHVHERQIVMLELGPVQVGVDAAQLAAEHRRGNHAGRAREHVADVEIGKVVDLFLAQGVAGGGHQGGGQGGRRVEKHDHGRHGAGRQVVHVGDGQGGDLRHGGVGVDVIAEVVLDNADAD